MSHISPNVHLWQDIPFGCAAEWLPFLLSSRGPSDGHRLNPPPLLQIISAGLSPYRMSQLQVSLYSLWKHRMYITQW